MSDCQLFTALKQSPECYKSKDDSEMETTVTKWPVTTRTDTNNEKKRSSHDTIWGLRGNLVG